MLTKRQSETRHRPVNIIYSSLSSLSWLLILLMSSGLFFTGVSSLKCYVCSYRENPTFTIDTSESFRIVDELSQDHCRHLDEVQCDRDHDVCVTIVQYKIDEGKRGPRSYSVSKGCYQSTALDIGPAVYKRGCHKETAEVKEDITSAQFPSRRINIHQAMRYTCVCNSNRCNSGRSNYGTYSDWRHRILTGLVVLLLHCFVVRNR